MTAKTIESLKEVRLYQDTGHYWTISYDKLGGWEMAHKFVEFVNMTESRSPQEIAGDTRCRCGHTATFHHLRKGSCQYGVCGCEMFQDEGRPMTVRQYAKEIGAPDLPEGQEMWAVVDKHGRVSIWGTIWGTWTDIFTNEKSAKSMMKVRERNLPERGPYKVVRVRIVRVEEP